MQVSTKHASVYLAEDIEAANGQAVKSIIAYASSLAAGSLNCSRRLFVSATDLRNKPDWICNGAASWEAVLALSRAQTGNFFDLASTSSDDVRELMTAGTSRSGEHASRRLINAVVAASSCDAQTSSPLITLLVWDSLPEVSGALATSIAGLLWAQGGIAASRARVEIVLVLTSSAGSTSTAALPAPYLGVGERWTGVVHGGGPPLGTASASFRRGAAAFGRTLCAAVHAEMSSHDASIGPEDVTNRLAVHVLSNTLEGWVPTIARWLNTDTTLELGSSECDLRVGSGPGESLKVRLRILQPLDVGQSPCTPPPPSLHLEGRTPLAPMALQLLLGGPIAVECAELGDQWRVLLDALACSDSGLLFRYPMTLPPSMTCLQQIHDWSAGQGYHTGRIGPLYLMMPTITPELGRTGPGSGQAILYRLACREEALVLALHFTAEGGAPTAAHARLGQQEASGLSNSALVQAAMATPCTLYNPMQHSSGAFELGLAAYQARQQQTGVEAQAAMVKAQNAERNAQQRAVALQARMQSAIPAAPAPLAQAAVRRPAVHPLSKHRQPSSAPGIPGASAPRRDISPLYGTHEDEEGATASEAEAPVVRGQVNRAAIKAFVDNLDGNSSLSSSESEGSITAVRRVGRARQGGAPLSRGTALVPARITTAAYAPKPVAELKATLPIPPGVVVRKRGSHIIIEDDEDDDEGSCTSARGGALPCLGNPFPAPTVPVPVAVRREKTDGANPRGGRPQATGMRMKAAPVPSKAQEPRAAPALSTADDTDADMDFSLSPFRPPSSFGQGYGLSASAAELLASFDPEAFTAGSGAASVAPMSWQARLGVEVRAPQAVPMRNNDGGKEATRLLLELRRKPLDDVSVLIGGNKALSSGMKRGIVPQSAGGTGTGAAAPPSFIEEPGFNFEMSQRG